MRIAFVGKGGSGKTTLSALFARSLAATGAPVLAIDADINQHLGASLGLSADELSGIPELGNETLRIKEYVRGENPRIGTAASMIKTTPPGRGSRLLYLSEPNPVWSYFERVVDGIRLLVTGQFEHDDIGTKCFHAKTGAVELLLNHLYDGPGEYVVADMTAGADSFASGLFTKFDVTFMVVEPTLKSVGVYLQYASFAAEYGIKLAVIANKTTSAEDVDFIRARTGVEPLAVVPFSEAVKKAEQGNPRELTNVEPAITAALNRMRAEVDATPKDWPRFLELAREFHVKNAVSWGNADTGLDLAAQIDPTFSFPE